MRLSRTIAYALDATLQLAHASPGVPIPCSQLARDGKLPERFLLRILRNLVTHGLLQSTRGVDGGYYLSRPAEKITLLDMVEAFDKASNVRLPSLTGFSTPVEGRILRTLRDAAQAAQVELQKLSLADLIRADAAKEKDLHALPRPPNANGLLLLPSSNYCQRADDPSASH
jgi:Rrf2 family transcriptional regulator, cysteine metabolism repressor